MNVLRFFTTLCGVVLLIVVAYALYVRATSVSGLLPQVFEQDPTSIPALVPPQGVILPGELNDILSDHIGTEDSSLAEDQWSADDELPLLDVQL